MIYFIRSAAGEVKIGLAGDPNKRLANLQTANASKLSLLAVIPGDATVERALHDRFGEDSIRGEWFYPTDRLLGFIEGLGFVKETRNFVEALMDRSGMREFEREQLPDWTEIDDLPPRGAAPDLLEEYVGDAGDSYDPYDDAYDDDGVDEPDVEADDGSHVAAAAEVVKTVMRNLSALRAAPANEEESW